ncbi:MAG: HAD family hydrolase, partial [Micromonosporaceae bacterium]
WVDSSLAASRLGPPLAQEAAAWFPSEQVPAVVRLYRSLYPSIAIERSRLLPGARESFEAVRDRDGHILVVTSKLGRLAEAHLEHLGLKPDLVVGDVFAEEKGVVLREHAATMYVGDHLGDVRAAKVANVLAVAVATGPISAGELHAAGADVVLTGLTDFPDWLHRTSAV